MLTNNSEKYFLLFEVSNVNKCINEAHVTHSLWIIIIKSIHKFSTQKVVNNPFLCTSPLNWQHISCCLPDCLSAGDLITTLISPVHRFTVQCHSQYVYVYIHYLYLKTGPPTHKLHFALVLLSWLASTNSPVHEMNYACNISDR